MATIEEIRLEIVERRQDLMRFALYLARDRVAAEDLVSDTMVRALEHPEQYEDQGHRRGAFAWMSTVMRNIFVSQRRTASSRRRGRSAGTTLVMSEDFCAPAQESAVMASDMLSLLRTLSAQEQRQLVAADHMTIPEMAAIYGQAEGTIKSRLSRSRAKLRTMRGEE